LAWPRGGDWLEDEAAGWSRAGIEVVVSLLEADEAAQLGLDREAQAAESNRIRFISFPIPDRGVPVSTRDALVALTDIRDELELGRNVAIHCRQSIGRSGLIAVRVLVICGVPPGDAVDVVSSARGLTVPETPGQLQWIWGLAAVQPAEAI